MQSKNSGEIMVLFKTEIFVKPYFTGVETMVSTETYIPMSVSTPQTFRLVLEYRWDRYRWEAPSSPSGPPNSRK